MKQITIKTSTHSYNIYTGKNIRFNVKEFLPKKYSSILIISDDTVNGLYLDDVKGSFSADEQVFHSVIPSGESSKSIHTYYQLQTDAIKFGLDRQSLIIALGGGVVGDIAGFAASTYMRGIDYIQMPTTILAHDSSVGGKVAINHDLGKNMIGSFYPPVAVVYDVHTLQSLSEREIRSGYAELIKEAFIADEAFFHTLMSTKLHEISAEQLEMHLLEGIKIKASIVENDEKETGIRKYLNFGHTLGHALETEKGYGTLTHGEAVAIGTLFALRVSESVFTSNLPYDIYYEWLKNNHYPLHLDHLNIEKIIKMMKSDKKAVNKQVQMVLLRNITEPTVVEVDDQDLKQLLDIFLRELVKN
ncbi:3-dehydroquinate synthase [Virgibacillus oceani]|uniref:3-dehydroquinate synthase n=1 Tax=Virgibacillus oceani TaxID=1479511 RepID=A0A917LY17_9BACI|nr:3-dehydroquinate synthase [Virgibacillus oceani]GGG65291.1 3-dehydroquinate synthase [Virgibacillus oceani]